MPFLRRPGKPTLHYVIDDHTDPWKKKPWVVLQHGYSRSHQFFRAWVPYLSRHYRVIRPDLRGFGLSPVDFDPYEGINPEGFMEDYGAICDMMGEPMHFVGESFAGIAGVLFAIRHPEKLRSLTLLSSPLSFPPETQKAFACGHESWEVALRTLGSLEWAKRIGGATRFPPDADPALVAWAAEEAGKTDLEVMIAMARAAATVDITAELPKVRVPTLGLYPTAGTITSREEQKIREGIPGIRLLNLPTRYHAIQLLMPAACATALLHFCGEVDGVVNRE